MEKVILEACVENLEEAKKAEAKGAHRLELCSRLDLDGMTPSIGLIKAVLQEVVIPVKVMIRPREGNFVYTETEINEMIWSIGEITDLGIRELVVGVLMPNGEVDLNALKKLRSVSRDTWFTFHKAIDMVSDPLLAIRQLQTIPNISSILTSGGAATAMEGAPMIRQMIKEAGDQIQIIAAGKITMENRDLIHQTIMGEEYHGRRIVGDLS